MFAYLLWFLFGYDYEEEDVVQNVVQAQGCTAPVIPVPSVEDLNHAISKLRRVE